MFQPSGSGAMINERQNDEHGMRLNACFGIAYQDSKNVGYVQFVVAVILPLILSAYTAFAPQGMPDWLQAVFTLSLVPFTLFFSWKGTKIQEEAADIQQLFECYVFQMPWVAGLWGEEPEISKRLMRRAERKLQDEEYHKSRADWYNDSWANLTTSSAGQAISNCQKMNKDWEKTLRDRFFIFCVLLAAAVIAGICVITLRRVQDIILLLFNLGLFAPVFVWIIEQAVAMRKDRIQLRLIAKLQESANPENGMDLLLLQRALLDHRRNNTQIPTFFFKLFKPDAKWLRALSRLWRRKKKPGSRSMNE